MVCSLIEKCNVIIDVWKFENDCNHKINYLRCRHYIIDPRATLEKWHPREWAQSLSEKANKNERH